MNRMKVSMKKVPFNMQRMGEINSGNNMLKLTNLAKRNKMKKIM